MDILLLLIPATLILLFAGIAFFYWTVKSGQYDDLDSPAHRILFDDDDALIPPTKNNSTKSTRPPHD